MAFMEVKQDLSFWGLLASFCVVIVGFVMVFSPGNSKSTYPDPVLKCRNVVDEQPCDYTSEITNEELEIRQVSDFESFKDSDPDKSQEFIEYTVKLNQRRGLDFGMADSSLDSYEVAENNLKNNMGRITSKESIPFLCPTCAEWSVYLGIKCQNPEVECGTVFLRKPFTPRGTYGDICPKCQYSANKARVDSRKASKKAEKDRKRKKP